MPLTRHFVAWKAFPFFGIYRPFVQQIINLNEGLLLSSLKELKTAQQSTAQHSTVTSPDNIPLLEHRLQQTRYHHLSRSKAQKRPTECIFFLRRNSHRPDALFEPDMRATRCDNEQNGSCTTHLQYNAASQHHIKTLLCVIYTHDT